MQPDKELMSPTPHFFPYPITFEHYVNIFVGKSFHRYLINSAIVTITTTFICLLFGSIGAFALARLDIRGRFGIAGIHFRSFNVPADCDRCSALRPGF